MRIGVDAVPFEYEHTGIVRYLKSVLDEMVSLDPTTEYLLYTSAPITPPLREGNWQVRVVPRTVFSRPIVWAQHELPRALEQDRVDVFWAQLTNLPLRLRYECFRVLTVHDLVHYVRPGSMRFSAWLRTRLMLGLEARAADAVIAVSQATADLGLRYLGIAKDHLHVVYEGASDAFRPVPRDQARAAVGHEFGLPARYVLCVGTIEPRKDHLTLLRAIESSPGFPLLVLVGGEGWRCRHIVAQIRRLQESGRVRYLGRVDDEWLPSLYSAAALSVYPSLYEGFGLPVLEAMSCGCPVLCSHSSSLPEVGGDAAFYFRAGDREDLTHKLRELLGDDQRLLAMSTAGMARARTFSFRRAAEEILDIVKQGSARRR